MGAFAAIAPIFQAIAPIAGSLLGGGQSFSAPPPAVMPAQQPLPQAPAAVAAPETPKVVTEAAAEEPVVDTEAARVRAAKRRASAESTRLFNLGSEDETVVLSKSLLGE